MTVCIAAACKEEGETRIVVCADKRASSALGSSETLLKVRPLGDDWVCLTAGTLAEIHALWRTATARFVLGDKKPMEIDAMVKGIMYEQKKNLAEEYTQTKYGISHDDFVKHGKDYFPADIFHNALSEIRNIDLGADFLIAGFAKEAHQIYHCDATGKTRSVWDYGICGEGEYLAASILSRRKQHAMCSLERTLYNVFEAKKYSEAIGSVGQLTTMAVLSPRHNEPRWLAGDVFDQLNDLYGQFGPKDLPDDFRLDGKVTYEVSKKPAAPPGGKLPEKKAQ